MISTAKKILFGLLTNRFSGYIISAIYPNLIPDIRWRGYRFGINREQVNKKLAASIFWGFYESSEIRFIHSYYKGKTDVLELGGSMGIVSSHIASLQERGRNLITVEANPFLAETLAGNVKRYLKEGNQFTVLTKAIAYHTDKVALQITGDSTETQVVGIINSGKNDQVIVDAITLSDIIEKFNLNNFTLVCDTEGAEAELLELEIHGLVKCSEIFIELHDTFFKDNPLTIESLKEVIISKHKFSLIDQHGPVMYFKKGEINTPVVV